MSITLKGKSGEEYDFEGPFYNKSSLKNESGVYAILCGDSLPPIDVGESDDIRKRVEDHDREDCWEENCSATVKYAAAYYYGETRRKAVEKDIRDYYKPPCGER